MNPVRFGIGVAIVLLGFFVFSHYVSHQLITPKTEKQLTILTYNTHQMGTIKKVEVNDLIHYLQHKNVDIVCMQEVEVRKKDEWLTLPELRHAFKKNYSYTYYDFKVYNQTRQFGNVVFSKFPLIGKHTIHYNSRSNISSCCDVVAFDDTLRLFINHLESNKIAKDSVRKASGLHKKIRYLRSHLKPARKLREEQAKILEAEIQQSPYPVLVVGDFNATPMSKVSRILHENMDDCFLKGSFGKLGNTYMFNSFLGIRIDYILCSESIKTIHSEVDTVKYSDHYPLIATVGW